MDNLVTNADGQISHAIHLHDNASKGRSGRTIPMHAEVCLALQKLLDQAKPNPDDSVITTERSKRTSAQVIVNLFARWYEVLGFSGCSSHSGRRTFITNAARKNIDRGWLTARCADISRSLKSADNAEVH
jgi:integrase